MELSTRGGGEVANQPGLNQLISLQGRRVLITGAAAGIGKAIACRFAEAGADLELVDVNGEGLAALQGELAEFGVNVGLHVVDLSKKEEVDRLWETLDGSGPDILVNNAGIYPFKDFLEVDKAFYARVMEINLNSVHWMCQHMIRRRLDLGGVIVNVGSIEAILPFKADLVHYSISKAGVIALTRALAKEYGKHGFRINVVMPGGIVTEGTKAVAKDIFRLRLGLVRAGIEFKWRLPIGRLGQPDEVARVVLVLASDLASYIHGAVIPVDGGFLSA